MQPLSLYSLFQIWFYFLGILSNNDRSNYYTLHPLKTAPNHFSGTKIG